MDVALCLHDFKSQNYPTPIAVALGVFDGIHTAHQKVIGAAVDCAKRLGGSALVFTFQTYPVAYFQPNAPLQGLTPWPLRLALIQQMGIDGVVAPPFDREIASIRAGDFITEILKKRLNASYLFVGYNFCFGRGREGTSDLLESMVGTGFEGVNVQNSVEIDGLPVSSTRIRQEIRRGNIYQTNRLLGRPYALYGQVVQGDARGRTLGIPTANVEIKEQTIPPPGIFGSRVILGPGVAIPALTYIGSAPTFRGKDSSVRIETLLLGQPGDLYGHYLAIELLTHLRGEIRFPDAAALVAQIRRDERAFWNWLALRSLPPLTPFPKPDSLVV